MGFLAEISENSKAWVSEFLDTQCFKQFVDFRCDPESATEFDILYFDESIRAKQMKSTFKSRVTMSKPKLTPFLTDTLYKLSKVYDCLPPNTQDLDTTIKYSYDIFPILQQRLYCPPRSVRPIMSINDRKASIKNIEKPKRYNLIEWVKSKTVYAEKQKRFATSFSQGGEDIQLIDEEEMKQKAATAIQAWWRRHSTLSKINSMHNSASIIQRYYKSFLIRKKL